MAGKPPRSWKDFHNAEEYELFMKHPSRVVRMEWRKARRQQHKGLTSHSWLEAHLQDGRRLRLEFFGDTGLTESMLTAGKGERESVIYENRVAGPHDFARPLTAKGLHEVAEAAAARPYSLVDWNCHHFVLEIWNKVVISLLQRTHYPDRVKTGVLWGATESIGKLWMQGANLAAQLGIQPPVLGSYASPTPTASQCSASPVSSRESPLARGSSSSSGFSQQSSPVNLPHGDEPLGEREGCASHISVEARQEEGGRISGELVVSAPRPCGDHVAQFSRLLEEGAICLLAPGQGLRTADMPPDQPQTSRAWAELWLPSAGEAGTCLADHLGSLDAVDLIMRVLVPGSDGTAVRVTDRGGAKRPLSTRFASLSSSDSIATRPASTPFASLSSESMESGVGDRGSVASAFFVVLDGNELRLAIYAVLRPAAWGGPPRRLRLLSGSFHEGRGGTFAYTLSDLKEQDAQVMARSCAEQEVNALQIALSTGDWGFVTLL